MRATILNNERGGMAALLSVIVLSLIMVSTLTSFYTYLENRARFQERIRMNYQMGYVVEDISRALMEAHEAFLGDPLCTGAAVRWIDCAQVCAPSTAGLDVPSGTPANALCVKSDNLNKIVNGAEYFCTYNVDGNNGETMPAYCSALSASNDRDFTGASATMVAANDTKTKVSNWYSRLDKFFDTTIVRNAPVIAGKMYPVLEARIQPPTLLGWMLPQAAVASAPPGYTSPGGQEEFPGGGEEPPGTTTPIPTSPNQPDPGETVGDCSTNPELDSCASQCEGLSPRDPKPAFCKNALSKVRVALVDGNGCGPTSTDARCKRCSGKERRNGACVKVSVCPPWIPANECVSTRGVDKRIHQMIRTADITNLTTYMWGTGEWGTCASGSRNRNVYCMNTDNSTIAANGLCTGAQPDSARPCFAGSGGSCGSCTYESGAGRVCYMCP
ncbi:MAG: thrombospondin type-1 domain-containing protein [Bdellovibrionota bacterium]